MNTTVPVNGEVEIIATVIENGVAAAATGTTTGTTTTTTSRPGAGTPVQNGTLVTFTTTIGRIEPREARTNNGEVRVKFISDGTSGSATITAYSGGAVGTLGNLLVGSAAARRVSLTAVTPTLPPSGGSTEVQARVESENGAAIPGVPVSFTTTAGTLSPTSAVTDANGIARTTLTATTGARITATAGAQTATVDIGIAARSGLSVSASPQTTTAGTPVAFTITTTPGQVVTNARIDYGDGDGRTFGTISGTRSDSHTYTRSGNFQVTVTADNAENAGTSVSVGGLPVTLTANPQRTSPNTPITFTASGIGTAQVDHYIFTYDDGTRNRTNGPSDSKSFATRGNHTARVDVIGVGGVLLGQASAVVVIEGL
ncbi:MAG TPA: Ig-like domain-containing protein [Vicinamibacterales bacterium]|nr:Ig-like domain-containing protein [Vicinamibacterales bacterium]